LVPFLLGLSQTSAQISGMQEKFGSSRILVDLDGTEKQSHLPLFLIAQVSLLRQFYGIYIMLERE
jgi:hypothetical protein